VGGGVGGREVAPASAALALLPNARKRSGQLTTRTAAAVRSARRTSWARSESPQSRRSSSASSFANRGGSPAAHARMCKETLIRVPAHVSPRTPTPALPLPTHAAAPFAAPQCRLTPLALPFNFAEPKPPFTASRCPPRARTGWRPWTRAVAAGAQGPRGVGGGGWGGGSMGGRNMGKVTRKAFKKTLLQARMKALLQALEFVPPSEPTADSERHHDQSICLDTLISNTASQGTS
jgi:hypothetical protein